MLGLKSALFARQRAATVQVTSVRAKSPKRGMRALAGDDLEHIREYQVALPKLPG
jgi:hypothetical protein